MSFLSFNFAIFLAVALVIFYLGRPSWRPSLLLGLSYAFYLTWGWGHALLLAAVTIGVYATALWIERQPAEQNKRALIALSTAVLVILLFAFKSMQLILAKFSHDGRLGGFDSAIFFVAPLGLSYYVFKVLGYLLDVYWEKIPAQRDFVPLALYTSFFPQIVSGPIQRAPDFFDQFQKVQNPAPSEFVAGLRRILLGLFKKVVIADQLAPVVATVFKNPSGFSAFELLFAAYCYAFQLYTDFSGITDIAIGIGQLFGVKGPENFNLPFFAQNIQVFWRRWHMSLTLWLTDYLFMPLRMSLRQLGTAGLCLAIFINMVAVGLWHGLSWNPFAFGIIHGVFMVVSVLTLKQRNIFFKNRPALARLRAVTAPLITFHLVVFGLIVFRANGLRSALHYLTAMIPGLRPTEIPAFRFKGTFLGIDRYEILGIGLCLVLAEAINWAMQQRTWTVKFGSMPRLVRWGLYYACIALLFYFYKGTLSFIYADF